MKFLSKELIDEMLKQAEADPELPSKLKGLTIRLLMVGTDCPGNEDRQYSLILADGKLISMEMETQPAPSDLRTAPLDAAKDHQGMVEARIRQLETILKSAVVTTKKGDSAKVMLGSIVTLQDLSSNEELRYTLVNPSEASPSKGKLSIASPTGKALLSRRQGETIAVAAPAGTLRYRIARIED